MRIVTIYVLSVLLAHSALAAIPKQFPAREALPPRKEQVPIVGSRTLQVGPIPATGNEHDLSKHASSIPASVQHVHSGKLSTAPDPPPGPVPVTHGSTNSVPNRPLVNSDNTRHDHLHPDLVGPVAGINADAATTAASASNTDVVAAALGSTACDAGGACAALGEAVVSAAEGPECRALHITGKCSAKCLSALKEALAHKLWDACVARCETDVVAGAAHRWVELCANRQPTLLDASKEALQIVATAPGAGRAIQVLVVLGVLITALAFGYRRGILQGTALRLQKRLKRRSSERSLV